MNNAGPPHAHPATLIAAGAVHPGLVGCGVVANLAGAAGGVPEEVFPRQSLAGRLRGGPDRGSSEGGTFMGSSLDRLHIGGVRRL